MITLICMASALLIAAAEGASIDVETADLSSELPRIPPVEPGDALGTFEVVDGYRLELVAGEPLVHDPVAAAFDEYGRCFVVEMRGYSERRDATEGAVRLLTDTDGDGRYDKSDVYVEGLAWPTAVACWDGGIFVGVAPDILYCKDTDGDNKADEQEIVFSGFGTTNVQGLLNSFQWTLDNRIHGAASSSGGDVAGVSLRGRDFSFDPRTRSLRAESGGAQHGLSFDDWGRPFVCSNSDHLQLIMYEDRYLANAPWLGPPGPRVSIASDGPQAEVFRISPVEPWREVRTRLRVQGLVPGPIEGGGRAAGYFTSATGVTIYRGDLLPELRGLAFIADVGSNLVHRKRLAPWDLELRGERVDKGREFLASRDIWFRPAQFANGPDGALHIIDVYREVIEHPDSLPPVIKKHLDLNSGNDRGRLYRVLPEKRLPPAPPRLGDLASGALVPLLGHDNAWHRETAARLLYQRRDASVAPALRLLAQTGPPLGRLHALYALQGLGALSTLDLVNAMQEPDPRVRAHAVRLAEPFAAGDAAIELTLVGAANDASRMVRYQAAFSAAVLGDGPKAIALATLMSYEPSNPWMHLAMRTALGREPLDALERALKRTKPEVTERAAAFAAETAVLAAGGGGRGALTEFLSRLRSAAPRIADTLEPEVSRALLARGMRMEARALGKQTTVVLDASAVREVAQNAAAALEERQKAIERLALFDDNEALPVLRALLDGAESAEIQSAALRTLQLMDAPATPDWVLEAWEGLRPASATRAVDVLFSRAEWLLRLLEAVEAGTVPARSLTAARIDAARNHGDGRVRGKAIALFAQTPGRRENLEGLTREVLSLRGDSERGATLFAENCAQCHRIAGAGHDVGPELTAAVSGGIEKIIANVLDPNREVDPRYMSYTVETTELETHDGIIAAETSNSITLKRANGETSTLLRGQIERIRNSELSIMPENWDETIGLQGIADVAAYLSGTR